MSEWQPIETAPVDGSLVLLSNAIAAEVFPGCLQWASSNRGARFIETIAVDPNGFGRAKATHWMPLPSPPETTP